MHVHKTCNFPPRTSKKHLTIVMTITPHYVLQINEAFRLWVFTLQTSSLSQNPNFPQRDTKMCGIPKKFDFVKFLARDCREFRLPEPSFPTHFYFPQSICLSPRNGIYFAFYPTPKGFAHSTMIG